jgi:orotate phosphoribosyltransferase
VLAVVSLIDRTNGAAQLPFPNFALLPVQAAVFAADAVPEHLAGIPAVKPGSRPDSK